MGPSNKPLPPEVAPPEWPSSTATIRVGELVLRGREMQRRVVPEDERRAWYVAVDATMASAFGRNSPEHLHARSVINRRNQMAGMPDDYPKRLGEQLSVVDEYIKVLARRAEDESAHVTCPQESPAVEKVLHLLSRFSRAANHLRTRRAPRPPLLVDDEHDVQYLLHALLDVHFDDVRPEESGPSVAGQNVRIDFVLEEERIAVETKMTRVGLRDKEVGDELLVDIARYQKHPSCGTLVCFVYDPGGFLKNPDGLENDLTRFHDGLDVRVVVRPKH